MQTLILLLILAILSCLVIAAIALARGRQHADTLRRALTLRVLLTVIVMGLLLYGAYSGSLQPQLPPFLQQQPNN